MPKVKKKAVSMPFGGGGGLTRYLEDYGGIKLEPKHVIIGVVGLLVFEILLHSGFL